MELVNRWWVAVLLWGGFGAAVHAELSPDTTQALAVVRTDALDASDDALDTEQLREPHALLTYASVLFYQGQSAMRRGDREATDASFQDAEAALAKAILQSDPDPDSGSRRMLRGQAAYLLGDLYLFVRNDRETAKAFYEAALRHLPTHAAATNALGRLLIPLPAPDVTTP